MKEIEPCNSIGILALCSDIIIDWIDDDIIDLGTPLINTLFTITYMEHHREYFMSSEKFRNLLTFIIYPSFISNLFTTTIPFIILTFLIEDLLKGDTSNLGPSILSSIITYFSAQEVSAWISILSLHSLISSVSETAWHRADCFETILKPQPLKEVYNPKSKGILLVILQITSYRDMNKKETYA